MHVLFRQTSHWGWTNLNLVIWGISLCQKFKALIMRTWNYGHHHYGATLVTWKGKFPTLREEQLRECSTYEQQAPLVRLPKSYFILQSGYFTWHSFSNGTNQNQTWHLDDLTSRWTLKAICDVHTRSAPSIKPHSITRCTCTTLCTIQMSSARPFQWITCVLTSH